MANIKHVFPDDDDPIFSGEFTINSPIQSTPPEEPTGDAAETESPEPPKRRYRGLRPVDPDEPWTIHINIGPSS
jgi:hypothetical protein